VNSAWLRILGLVGAVLALLLSNAGVVGAQEVQAVPGPSNLTATAISPSRIDLDWTKTNSGQVVEYHIYYAHGAPVATVPASQSSYSDTGLQPWTEYRYYITGANASGSESGPSNVATARTLDGTPPTAPGSLAGSAVSATQVSLTWTAASDPQSGVDEYVVYRGGNEVGRTSGLAYQDNGLAPDTQYSYEVSAVNGQGDQGSRAGPIPVRTLAEPPPDPPRNLSAAPVSASAIDLSWTPPADDSNVTSYRVYRDGSPVATVSATGYRNTGLASYTSYEFRVTSVDGDGDESSPSNAASARTLDGTAPTKPGNLAGSAISQSQISLTWTAASDPQTGVSEYVVYRGGSEIGRTSGLTYQDNGLTSDSQYSYEVAAVNGQQLEGAAAGPVQVRTLTDPIPDPPRQLSASAVSATAIDVSWTAPVDDGNVSSYKVYRNGSPVGTSTGTSYRDTGLASYTTYEYRVTSVSGDGDESPMSNAASARTLDGTPPTAPGNLAGAGISQSQISLTWTAASDPETGIAQYVVYRDGSEIARTVALSYEDGGLETDQPYDYAVSAINGQQVEGSRADPIEVRTLSNEAPDPPTGLSATALDEGSVDLAWNTHPDEANLDGYRVYRDGAFVAGTAETAYRDTGLDPFTTYVYTVTAVGTDGDESSPSQPATVTTPDRTPPTVPEDIAAVAVGTQRIDVTWSPSSDEDSGIADYRVFRDGAEVGTPTGTEYQDTGLESGTTYEYRVSAVNGEGLESNLSVVASARTLDVEGPPAPSGLTATPAGPSQISLTWVAPADGAASYNVFRDDVFIGAVMATTFVDTGLQPATTYRYSVASVDTDGIQGPRSGQVSATTAPSDDVVPPAAPTGLRLITP
jgi:chitodextrinase